MQPPKGLSALAYAFMERIGQRRRGGASQAMLSKCSRLDPRNLHMPMTMLESAGHMYEIRLGEEKWEAERPGVWEGGIRLLAGEVKQRRAAHGPAKL